MKHQWSVNINIRSMKDHMPSALQAEGAGWGRLFAGLTNEARLSRSTPPHLKESFGGASGLVTPKVNTSSLKQVLAATAEQVFYSSPKTRKGQTRALPKATASRRAPCCHSLAGDMLARRRLVRNHQAKQEEAERHTIRVMEALKPNAIPGELLLKHTTHASYKCDSTPKKRNERSLNVGTA